MTKLGREARLPDEMQGRWTDVDDPAVDLIVHDGEITCFGKIVEYDYKIVGCNDGALTVDLKIEDGSKEDAFQRENITGLVVTPEGELHAYNVKFASQFVRSLDA